MPCESCLVQFSVFRRRRACPECERWYCSGCLRRGGGAMCPACRALSTRPLARSSIAHLKVRDLQAFLQRQNVSTRGCVEKEELLSLCVTHVNSSAYRRRTPRSGSGAFSSLKGFTNNINEFINNAFELRTAHPAPAPPNRGNCYNYAHPHARAAGTEAETTQEPISPGVPRAEACPRPPGFSPSPPAASSRSSSLSAPVDTADCFEVEDLADGGWEFVTRPADPLPNDSEVLLTVEERAAPPPAPTPPPAAPPPSPPPSATLTPPPVTPQRASSELDLRRSPSADADTNSLKDEPTFSADPGTPPRVSLEQLVSESQLQTLTVRQLKQLLSCNRVEVRGCLERADLLERASTLYRDHAKYRAQLESLPLEECCKICMAAPLECVLLECGHMAACTRCGKRLAECPICRRYVTRAVRFFRS